MYYKTQDGIMFSTVVQDLPLASKIEIEEEIIKTKKFELLQTIKTTIEKTMETIYPPHKQLNYLMGLYGEEALKNMKQFIQTKRENYKKLEVAIKNAKDMEELNNIQKTISSLL